MIESYTDLLFTSEYSVTALAMFVLWFLRTIIFPAMISALIVRMTISLSHHYAVLAHPSDRGSHSIPTPRLGGLGAAAAFYITCLLMSHWGAHVPLEPWRLALLIGGAWALIGGALDDFQELPPRWKLLLQIAASGSVVMFDFAPVTFDLPFMETIHLPAAAGMTIAFFVSFFLMNIFNFMDGMDGQASLFGIITGLGLAAYIGNHGFKLGFGITWNNMFLAGMAAITVGSLIGVLIHNYPGRNIKRKTFLGDCGSQFYGFILAIIALEAAQGPKNDRFPWIASLILFSPFIYDVVFTLIRRVRRRENLTQAHRSHLYQRLMVAGWTHGRTLMLNTALYVIMMIFAWLYAANAGNGFTQLGVIIMTGVVLTAYTYFVFAVENQAVEARRQREVAE